jgi:hypothetical protein
VIPNKVSGGIKLYLLLYLTNSLIISIATIHGQALLLPERLQVTTVTQSNATLYFNLVHCGESFTVDSISMYVTVMHEHVLLDCSY